MLDKYYQTPNTIISDGDLVLHAKQNWILGATLQPFDYVRKNWQSIIWDLNKSCPIEAKMVEQSFF
jgi:hypothetical protein